MNNDSFEKLQLNDQLIDGFYGKMDFLLNKSEKNDAIKLTNTKKAVIATSPQRTDTKAAAEQHDFEHNIYNLVLFKTNDNEANAYKDIFNKMLSTLNVEQNKVNIIQCDYNLETLVSRICEIKLKCLFWVANVQPKEISSSHIGVITYAHLKSRDVHYIFTENEQSLNIKENKLALWSFFKGF